MRASVLALAFASATVAVCTSTAARAQQSPCLGRSVCDARQPSYFYVHGSALGLLALGAIVTGNAFPPSAPAVEAVAPPARALANATLALELGLPVPTLLTGLNHGESFDAAITYGQLLLASQLTDHVLRSIHLDSSATLGFAGAIGSAYLFDQSSTVDIRLQGAFWGVQLGLATANATLNVRGGRSGAGATFVGAGLGVGLGVLTQFAHGYPYHSADERRRVLVPSPVSIFEKRNSGLRFGDARDHVWLASVAGVASGFFLSLLAPSAVRDTNLEYRVTASRDGAGVVVTGDL